MKYSSYQEFLQYKELYREHKYSQAYQVLEDLYPLEPNDIYIILEYGRILVKQGDYNKARVNFEELLDTKNKTYAMLELGKLEVLEDNYDKARNYFEELLDTKSRTYAMLELGKLEVVEGNYDKARNYFEELLDTKNRIYAMLELGRLEVAEGNYDKARNYFESLLDTQSKTYAMLELGRLEVVENNYDKAHVYFETLLNTRSRNCAMLELGKLEVAEKNYDKARGYFEELLDTKNRTYAMLELGRLEAVEKNYAKAHVYFEKLLDTKNRTYAVLELGRLEVAEKNYDKARGYFESLLNTQSRNYAMLALGKLEVAEKNYVKARGYFELLLNTQSRNYAMLELKKLEAVESIIIPNNSIICQALTKIYFSDISITEIQNLNLNKVEKDILLVVYYHKNLKNICPSFICNLIKHYQNNIEVKKILTQLYNRVRSKKQFFNICIYEDILKTKVNLNANMETTINVIDIASNSNRGLETSNEMNFKPTVQVEQPKKEDKQIHMIKINGTKITPRYQSVSFSKNISHKIEMKLLGDEFKEEFLEIDKFLYIKMQDDDVRKDATKAWDILNQLSQLPCTTENLKRCVNLFERCQIIISEKKKMKIYKK